MGEENQEEKYSDNRRTYSRKEVNIDLSYRVITPLGGEGTTYNIGEGGLCITLDKEISIGTMLELKFELPGKESVPVETFAKVMWQNKTENGFLTGIKFGT